MTDLENNLIKYEIAYLIASPEAEPPLVDLILKHGAVNLQGGEAKSVSLAYPIKKHASAFLGVKNFEMSAESVRALQGDLRLAAGVLRSLVFRAPKAKRLPKEKPPAEVARAESPVSEIKSPQPDQITNEALEQKLEEILRD